MENNITMYVNNSYALVNKDLSKQLKIMLDCIASVEKNTWKYAEAVNKIIVNELFKDDFKTQKEFCEKIGLSTPLATRYVKACEFIKAIDEKYNLTKENMTVSKCYILTTLKENMTLVLDYALEHNAHIEAMPEKKMVDYVKAILNILNGANNEEAETEEAETEEANNEEAETEEAESVADDKIKGVIEGDFLNLSIGSKFYSIPMEELEEYRA